MKIPKRFELAGTEWEVVYVEGLDALGYCRRDKAMIELRKGMTKQVAESTFTHELVHAILYTMGKSEGHDEQFTDAFGSLLHQFMKTAK